MLDHLHVEDDVKLFTRRSEILGGAHPVVDPEAHLVRMDGGRLDVLFRRIDAGDGGPEPCHGFGQKPAAAADIEEAQALEGQAFQRVAPEAGRHLLLDELQADGIEHMQHPEFTFGVPPFGGHAGEFLDFRGIEGGGEGCHVKIQISAGAIIA